MDDGVTARPRDARVTSARILAGARLCFSRHGYDGTTVRAVAAEAGVAPNLVTRYFGGKPGLFEAATACDLGIRTVLPGPMSSLGARIATEVVGRWEVAEPQDPLLMMLRSAATSDEAASRLASFLDEQALRPLAAHLRAGGEDPGPAEDRVAGISALICGVITARYVLRSGPLATATAPAVESWLGERLQRLLEGPPPPPLGERAAPT